MNKKTLPVGPTKSHKKRICVFSKEITALGRCLQLTFFYFFAKTSHVRFVPGGDHLGIACIFHDWKKMKKGEPSDLAFFRGKRWNLFSHLFLIPTCL